MTSLTHRFFRFFSLIAGGTFLSPLTAFAQETDPISITVPDPNYTFIQGLAPSDYLVTIINVLLGGAGVASFVFLLWGGIQWITAGSDKDAIEKARKKLLNALIGLAVVFSSYVIMYLARVIFNVDLIGFDIRPLGQ
jgi:hypothetical protein